MGLCWARFAEDTTVVRPQVPECASFKLRFYFGLAVMSYTRNQREKRSPRPSEHAHAIERTGGVLPVEKETAARANVFSPGWSTSSALGLPFQIAARQERLLQSADRHRTAAQCRPRRAISCGQDRLRRNHGYCREA